MYDMSAAVAAVNEAGARLFEQVRAEIPDGWQTFSASVSVVTGATLTLTVDSPNKTFTVQIVVANPLSLADAVTVYVYRRAAMVGAPTYRRDAETIGEVVRRALVQARQHLATVEAL
jgi:hypothetical protein